MKRALCRVRHKLRDNETQSLTALARKLTGVGKHFAANAQRCSSASDRPLHKRSIYG